MDKPQAEDLAAAKRILVVEDEAITAMALKLDLLKLGYEVLAIVDTGEEAILKAAELLPDLILMDISLLGPMSGIEAAVEIKKSLGIPIIYLSAHTDAEIIAKAKMSEPFGYLPKPCNVMTMRSTIEMALYKSGVEIVSKRLAAEKAELEAQNLKLQKAESLGRMAGAIAHNFNNMLAAVMGNLELAMDDLPPEAIQFPNLIAAMKAARRAADMSGLMLTYLGQMTGKQEALDLSEACRQILPMMQASMPEGADLDVDLPTPGPTIKANGHQIQQLLINLAKNAMESLPDGYGVIHLKVNTVSPSNISTKHRFPLGWQPQDIPYACLEMTDPGCGIAEKNLDEIFDPFYSSKFTGRGLGLAVVLGIVRAHNAAITVESKVGQGSTLQCFFPLATAIAHKTAISSPDSSNLLRGGVMLLVEDEKIVRNMIKEMLTLIGFTVLEASDGVEAVEVFRQHKDEIRLVLSDLSMPRMDGWETLTALRQIVPGLPVILASGYDQDFVMAGDHPEVPQAFLSKPFELSGLKNAIQKALEKT